MRKMRVSFILVVMLATFAASCLNLASAKEAVLNLNSVTSKVMQSGGDDQAVKLAAKVADKKAALDRIKKYDEDQAAKKLSQTDTDTKVAASIAKNDDAIKNFKWGGLTDKLKEGKLKVDTNKPAWRRGVEKAKAAVPFSKAKEQQVAKTTEKVAETLVKNPSKWSRIKKVLKITFLAVTVSLILIGLTGMIGSL